LAELVEARPSTSSGSESVTTLMIGVPTATVTPSCTRIASTTPSKGEGSSTSDFAVSISTRVWFTVTVSPGATFHETISASVRPSPASGSRNSELLTIVLTSIGHRPVDRFEHAVGVGQVGGLQLGRREGCVESGDAQHRGFERVEGALSDRRGDL